MDERTIAKLPEHIRNAVEGIAGTLVNGEFLDVDSLACRLQIELVFGGFRMRFWSDDLDTIVHVRMLDSGEEATVAVGYNETTQKPILDWQTEATIDMRVAVDVVAALLVGLAPFLAPGPSPTTTGH